MKNNKEQLKEGFQKDLVEILDLLLYSDDEEEVKYGRQVAFNLTNLFDKALTQAKQEGFKEGFEKQSEKSWEWVERAKQEGYNEALKAENLMPSIQKDIRKAKQEGREEVIQWLEQVKTQETQIIIKHLKKLFIKTK